MSTQCTEKPETTCKKRQKHLRISREQSSPAKRQSHNLSTTLHSHHRQRPLFAAISVRMPPFSYNDAVDDYPTALKSVRFQEKISIHVCASFKHSEKVVKDSYWMGPKDFLQIRQDCVDALQLAMNPSTKTKTDVRGLEHKTPTGSHRRFENRAKAKRAVFQEQMYQSETGFRDPEYIAALYRTITHRSRVEANIMGIRDEMAAKRCAPRRIKFEI